MIGKKIKIMLISLGLVFIGMIIYQLINAQSVEKDLKEIGLELTGIITDKKELRYGHDFGWAGIDVYNSNYSQYDSRGNGENYFFVLKKKIRLSKPK